MKVFARICVSQVDRLAGGEMIHGIGVGVDPDEKPLNYMTIALANKNLIGKLRPGQRLALVLEKTPQKI
jgi:hypothetical protein